MRTAKSIILWNLDQILHLDSFSYACHWIKNYLKTNISVEPDNAKLCQRMNKKEYEFLSTISP